MTGDKDDYSESVALNAIASALRSVGGDTEQQLSILAMQIGRVADAICELAEAARGRE